MAFDNILNSIIAADFNNDGKADLGVLNEDPQSISVLLGSGDGTFRTALVSAGGPAGQGGSGYLTYSDLNHDGNLDLAAVYANANMISVLLGKGDGTFQPPRNYATGNRPTSMGVLPLDDGNTALFTIDAITGNGVVQFAKNDGTVAAPALYPVGTKHGFTGILSSIAATDLNGDQLPDVITYDRSTGTVDVLIANRDGTLQTPAAYALTDAGRPSPPVPQSLAVGDLNGDGKPDVAVIASDGINVLLGNGDGTFSPPQTTIFGTAPSGIVLADFDGDGKLDAAVSDLGLVNSPGTPGSAWILLGKGDGSFQAPVSYGVGALHANSLVETDWNGDGQPDLAVATSTVFNTSPVVPGIVTILLNAGNGVFRSGSTIQVDSSAQIMAAAAGDLNGDGKADLAVAVRDSTVGNGAAIFLGNGDGTFKGAPFVVADETNPQDLKITDLNADGRGDLILLFCCGVADSEYLLGKGDGTFNPIGHIPSGSSPVSVAVTDFNGDGLPDLAFADTYGYVATPASFFPVVSGSCAYYITPAAFPAAAAGASFDVSISTTASCNWNVSGLPPWVTTPAATSGSGSGTITLHVAANVGSARSATFTVAGRLITITQAAAGCGFALDSAGRGFAALGGSGNVTVTGNAGCVWTVIGAPSWVTFTSASGKSGSSALFTVAANSGASRSATITIGGISFTIDQVAGSLPGLSSVGSLAQVAAEGTWIFTEDVINLGTSSATARFNFFDNSGSPLMLPLTFPQSSSSSGAELAATLDRALNPNAQVILQSTGPTGTQTVVGSGQLQATGMVSGFGIFSYPALGWNAVTPLETRNATKYYLVFDNTESLATGIAIANLTRSEASVTVIIRDDTGAQIGTGTINLAAQGHSSFMLNDPQLGFAVTNGKRGTIEFDTPSGGQISVLGLRTNGPALTTLPVLASTDAAGGAIAHATYNGGFTSTFYIVNTGTSSAQFTLSFFDENGNPLSVPLLLPQSSSNETTSTLTQMLAAGAMLVVRTVANDAAASVLGSAQLSTAGNVSGFEIFNWTTFGKEASVPLETRKPNSFVLVYDDTNGLTTGVALSNVAASAAIVTMNIYDDAGNLLQTSSLNLAGRGHTSFLLPSNYSVATNRRGMVEFVVPAGGQISAIGLRAKADGTLTTIPVLTK